MASPPSYDQSEPWPAGLLLVIGQREGGRVSRENAGRQTPGGARGRFLWTLKHTLNRLTIRLARAGRGPFSLVRHVGRRSGREYETPVILAEVPGGFVAELTYGPDVDWYRNIVAAGHCIVIHRGQEYAIDQISSCAAEQGLAAYPYPARLILRLTGRHEFRLLGLASGG